MEIQSPEISPHQEYKSEIHLKPQIVQNVYQKVTGGIIENGNRVCVHDLINDEVFNKERLEENRDVIEKFADQLQFRFFKQDVGSDWHYANNDKYQTQWTNSEYDVKHLLALISAIGLGRFTTSSAELRAAPKTPIRYLIDKDRYLKNNPKI